MWPTSGSFEKGGKLAGSLSHLGYHFMFALRKSMQENSSMNVDLSKNEVTIVNSN